MRFYYHRDTGGVCASVKDVPPEVTSAAQFWNWMDEIVDAGEDDGVIQQFIERVGRPPAMAWTKQPDGNYTMVLLDNC